MPRADPPTKLFVDNWAAAQDAELADDPEANLAPLALGRTPAREAGRQPPARPPSPIRPPRPNQRPHSRRHPRAGAGAGAARRDEALAIGPPPTPPLADALGAPPLMGLLRAPTTADRDAGVAATTAHHPHPVRGPLIIVTELTTTPSTKASSRARASSVI
ncbi:hypothetical protein DICSQDRAFT_167527 [Dichomitus squalens LYAD-421 SS1]|uniref:uncharacterized protein n=1 Tax=Dichomitus squalens (strain LYAD-421) TaxID=732165 RepID=UPI0004415D7D|nr:uncharacterized protein DICSQDRAFT_167527 [Dichomitus squalens LYAD-421 SS1]EJF64366.1 hypothetical protein DICSQDRAFT_167527 [Dichomitus squalens LYAD-421 SS1]